MLLYDALLSVPVVEPVINVQLGVLQEEVRGRLLETEFIHELPEFSPLDPLRS